MHAENMIGLRYNVSDKAQCPHVLMALSIQRAELLPALNILSPKYSGSQTYIGHGPLIITKTESYPQVN